MPLCFRVANSLMRAEEFSNVLLLLRRRKLVIQTEPGFRSGFARDE
jgi:hypothetical protein